MKKAKIKFICTGMCGASQPIYEYCTDCTHANFKMRLGKITIYYGPLWGCEFCSNGELFVPAEGSYLWKVADEVVAFAGRSFKRWGKK
jgi:hypothetical protein